MKNDPSGAGKDAAVGVAPLTLEGFSILHQMFRLRSGALRRMADGERLTIAQEAAGALAGMEQGEDGQSAAFTQLGHKSDLMLVHFRPDFDALARAEATVADLALSDFLEPAGSYLSMVEIGLYEGTMRLRERLAAKKIAPDSPQARAVTDATLAENRERLAARLYPPIPQRRYLCFYPMNKRRGEHLNWYQLAFSERQRLMHDHGMIGRRFAGQVTQIISGSVGFDDWEWGVDLFADDPLVFKKLIYEMRFDESSALYAEFGPFYVGIRLNPEELRQRMAGSRD